MPQYPLEQQSKCALHVRKCFTDAQSLLKTRHESLVEVYEAYTTFKMRKQSNWSTAFKVNKAFQVVNEWVPDIIAKSPRWIVTPNKLAAFEFEQIATEEIDPQQAQAMQFDQDSKKAKEYSAFLQDFLTYMFDEYAIADKAEDWAKNTLSDGMGWVQVSYKYQVSRVSNKVEREEEEIDELTMEPIIKKVTKKEYEERVSGECPSVEVVDWTEAYFDPRFKDMKDRPYFIRVKSGVRLADVLRTEKYMNKDKVRELAGLDSTSMSDENYKSRVMAITGIPDADPAFAMKDTATLKYYYGFFNFSEDDPEKEHMYEIVTINDLLVLCVEEIAEIPVEEAKCFPDTKTAFATGVVEPMISIQDEMNYKRNSASEYINKSLNRQVIWSPNSGIDPRKLNDPVIITTTDGQTALNNLVERTFPEINPSYFQEGNDLERQLQAMTFRTDVSQPQSQQALTDTATGARIKFFETSKVKAMVRKRFERAMERLAYKLILATFENVEDNIVIKKMGTEEYWMANKEALRNAVERYTVKIETNSSSFSDAESRREDAIAWKNILADLAAAGVPVNWNAVLEDLAGTFEKRDPSRYMGQALPQMPAGPTGAPGQTEQPMGSPETTAELTQQVAGGTLPMAA